LIRVFDFLCCFAVLQQSTRSPPDDDEGQALPARSSTRFASFASLRVLSQKAPAPAPASARADADASSPHDDEGQALPARSSRPFAALASLRALSQKAPAEPAPAPAAAPADADAWDVRSDTTNNLWLPHHAHRPGGGVNLRTRGVGGYGSDSDDDSLSLSDARASSPVIGNSAVPPPRPRLDMAPAQATAAAMPRLQGTDAAGASGGGRGNTFFAPRHSAF